MSSKNQNDSSHIYECFGNKSGMTRTRALDTHTSGTPKKSTKETSGKNDRNKDKKVSHSLTIENNGLVNIGNTCFINSILQVLFHLPQVMNDIALAMEKIDDSYFSLLRETLRVYYCYKSSQRSAEITRLYDVLSNVIPSISDGRQHDAVEFFQLYIEQCQREISPYLILPTKNKGKTASFSLVQMLENEPFTRNFMVSLLNEVKCSNCKKENHGCKNMQSNYMLLIPMANQLGSALKLEECIKHFFQPEKVTNLYCDKCKSSKTTLCHSICRLPRFLFIQLERFNSSLVKNTSSISYPPELDMAPYIDDNEYSPPFQFTSPQKPEYVELDENPEYMKKFSDPSQVFLITNDVKIDKRVKNVDARYQLYAIVLHDGTFSGGHYRTAIMEKGTWTVFSDTSVQPNGTFSKSSPYCFVYIKKNA